MTSLTPPLTRDAQVLIVRITCASPVGCAEAVTAREPGGKVSIAVNGQTLWQALCNTSGACDRAALGKEPTVAFVTESSVERTYQVRIIAVPDTIWPVAAIQIEWQTIPSLIQGIAYSPFRDCQNPNWGPFPTEEQIREDLLFVQHMGNAIRTYSSTNGQGRIPTLARQVGLRVSAGAWLESDKDANAKEIESLISLASTVELESVIVGNEVLLRGDLTEDELIAYIQWVREAVDVPVTTAEIGGILLQHPRVMDAVDYYLVHHYAYWDGISIENAARYVVDQYHEIQAQASGRRVVIGETGWPSAGPPRGNALPSPENQRRFLREFITLAQQENVEFYYFASFDELWKTEGGVGPYWGMMHSDRRNKYDLQSVLIPLNDEPHPVLDVAPIPSAMPGPSSVLDDVFPVYTTYAAPSNHFAPSGWMGDLETIHFDDCARLSDAWEDRVMEIGYTPSLTDPEGWAGIYWQEPENNWGNKPGGHDLRGFTQLRFRARSAEAGARVKFFVGGTSTGGYPSSIPQPIFTQVADEQGFVTLSANWQEFHIDLREADLSHVIDGFGWVAERERTPKGVTFYLDDIVFDRQLPPVTSTLPPPRVAPLASTPTPPPAVSSYAIYAGLTLSPGFDMGVNTSGHLYDWVTDRGGHICMAYPAGQSWGVVYLTVGRPAPMGQRHTRDFSMYQTLAVDLRGDEGGETVYIGIKDHLDPDDGSETKFPVTVTSEWQMYTFPLSTFATANLTEVYIPIEFVFEPGLPSETVCFRNVRLSGQSP